MNKPHSPCERFKCEEVGNCKVECNDYLEYKRKLKAWKKWKRKRNKK